MPEGWDGLGGLDADAEGGRDAADLHGESGSVGIGVADDGDSFEAQLLHDSSECSGLVEVIGYSSSHVVAECLRG